MLTLFRLLFCVAILVVAGLIEPSSAASWAPLGGSRLGRSSRARARSPSSRPSEGSISPSTPDLPLGGTATGSATDVDGADVGPANRYRGVHARNDRPPDAGTAHGNGPPVMAPPHDQQRAGASESDGFRHERRGQPTSTIFEPPLGADVSSFDNDTLKWSANSYSFTVVWWLPVCVGGGWFFFDLQWLRNWGWPSRIAPTHARRPSVLRLIHAAAGRDGLPDDVYNPILFMDAHNKHTIMRRGVSVRPSSFRRAEGGKGGRSLSGPAWRIPTCVVAFPGLPRQFPWPALPLPTPSSFGCVAPPSLQRHFGRTSLLL